MSFASAAFGMISNLTDSAVAADPRPSIAVAIKSVGG
jgi:hypothetical protein